MCPLDGAFHMLISKRSKKELSLRRSVATSLMHHTRIPCGKTRVVQATVVALSCFSQVLYLVDVQNSQVSWVDSV